VNKNSAGACASEISIYGSADLGLVGGTVRQATGKWPPELFAQSFAPALEIRSYQLNLTPTGDADMGGGVYLRPRDELKLGQLCHSGGVSDNVRVISREWVWESTAHHSTFLKPAIPEDVDHECGYGWHIHHCNVSGRVYRK
jgi:CubicO group peptidase (beta-lactamase class C family)